MAQYKMHLLVCAGTGCRASQSDEIIANLNSELKKQGLENDAQVVATGCFGFCEKGPIVKVIPDNTFYTQVKPSDCAEIVSEHILKGRRVNRLLYEDPETRRHVEDSKTYGLLSETVKDCTQKLRFHRS